MSIKIYIRTTEPYSHTLVKYLQSKQVEFSQVEVSLDKDGFQEMVRKSGQKRVPVVEIDDQILVGFDRNRLDDLLTNKIR
jgi:glutaredoxin